jgi:hypothetical protein
MYRLRLSPKTTKAVQRLTTVRNQGSGSSNQLRILLLLVSMSLFCSSLSALPIVSPADMSNTTLVDFNTLAGGNCNLCGTSVTNQFSDIGVTFNNPSNPGDDTTDTNITPYVPGASGNMLYVYQGGLLDNQNAQPFEILFSVPVTAVGFEYGSSINAYLQLSAYGAGNTLLETEDFTGSPAPIGLAGFAGLSETSAITQLDVSYLNVSDQRTLNFSIGNVLFVDPPLPTPEPSTLLLVGAGLLGTGISAARARRR